MKKEASGLWFWPSLIMLAAYQAAKKVLFGLFVLGVIAVICVMLYWGWMFGRGMLT